MQLRLDAFAGRWHASGMSLPIEVAVPLSGFQLQLKAGQTTILVGANGSGKTRFASWLEAQLSNRAHRISAHRALSLNPRVTKVSEDQSRLRLLSGIDTPQPENYATDGNLHRHREGNRWGSNSATHLLNDYDALVQWLFAEQNNIAVQHLTKSYEGGHLDPENTAFKTLAEMWQRVLPTRRLIVSGDNIEVEPIGSAPAERYSASQMSDGERAIFYMIGQVLFAPTGVIIFDEPELHVHRAVLSRLWDELEARRPDCAFVLITHDLEFAASRSARKLVVRSFSPPTDWQIEEVPEESGFDEQLTTLILGSRRPILFVEGDGGSLDLAIYRACYPDVTVVARGSCEQVIRSVRTMRANASLTRVTCAGLVDADSRSDAEVARLTADGISVLPVSEVENLLLIPAVANAILDHDSHSDDEKRARISKLERALYDEATRPEVQSAIVLDYCRRRIDRALQIVSFEGAENEAALASSLMAKIADIDVGVLAAEIRSEIGHAIAAGDLQRLLRHFDRKSTVLAFAASLRGLHKDAFTAWLIRAVKDPKRAELRGALRAVLPEIEAR